MDTHIYFFLVYSGTRMAQRPLSSVASFSCIQCNNVSALSLSLSVSSPSSSLSFSDDRRTLFHFFCFFLVSPTERSLSFYSPLHPRFFSHSTRLIHVSLLSFHHGSPQCYGPFRQSSSTNGSCYEFVSFCRSGHVQDFTVTWVKTEVSERSGRGRVANEGVEGPQRSWYPV